MKRSASVIVLLLAAASGTVFAYRKPIRNHLYWLRHAPPKVVIPPAEPFTPPAPLPAPTPTPSALPTNTNKPAAPTPAPAPAPAPSANTNANANVNAMIKASINLAVPFVSQAPFKVWDAFHEDACEEAAMLMVAHYFSGKPVGSLQDQDDELHAEVDWETTEKGYGLSITAAEAATVLEGFYGFKNVELKLNPTIDDMKGYLNKKLPIIVPAYGKELENPNFRNGGPLYHFLVVKGYTGTTWITNDPGTRLGADFTYRMQNIMDSMHDWNGGDVPHGQKVIIVVHPN